MKRRNFFKFLGLSVAAPTVITKAVGELKKTAKDNVVKIEVGGDATITTAHGRTVLTKVGRGPHYIHRDKLTPKYLALAGLEFDEGTHLYNEDGFYVVMDGEPVLIGTMFAEGSPTPGGKKATF